MKARTHGFNPDYSDQEPSPEDIQALDGPAVLEFGAPWCGHCQAARPHVEEAFRNHPDLPHIKIHDGKGKPLGRAFGVKLWPTLIFLVNGREVERVVRPRETGTILEGLERIVGP